MALNYPTITIEFHSGPRGAFAFARRNYKILSQQLAVVPLVCHVRGQKAKQGLGTIAEGFLDEEVLECLEDCPQWREWHEELPKVSFA